MKLLNPLKTLNWNSLFRSSRGRLRRRPSNAAVNLAAEVLEQRAMLSANVNVTQNGAAITLTSQTTNTENISVEVFRYSNSQIEIVADSGTLTLNGGGTVTSLFLSATSVSGITVFVGAGYDKFQIYSSSESGYPALNVGAGGITFQGGTNQGDDLEVYNDSSAAMTIGGNITVRGNTVGSALAHNSAVPSAVARYGDSILDESWFKLYTNSGGGLTINGSVSASQSGAGTADLHNEVYTDGSGNLKILGSVTETLTLTGSGYQENDVATWGTGSITINGNVTQSATGGTDNSVNYIEAESSSGGGNLSLLGSAMQTASDSFSARNYVITDYSGSVSIARGLTQTATGTGTASSAENHVFVAASGGITVGSSLLGGGVTQTATSGKQADNSISVFDVGSANITIGKSTLGVLGGSVRQTATGTGNGGDKRFRNEVVTETSGSVTIAGSVTQTGTGASTSDPSWNHVETTAEVGGGSVTVGGSITQNAAATGNGWFYNDVDTYGSGSVTVGYIGSIPGVGGITQNATGSSYIDNGVFSVGSGNVKVGAGGITIYETSSGGNFDVHYNGVFTDSAGSLTTTGLIKIKATNSSSGPYSTDNFVDTEGGTGSLTALGVSITDSGSQDQYNWVASDVGAVNIGLLGITINGSGSGYHDNDIYATNDSGSKLTIAGSVIVTDSTTGSGNQSLDIWGNTVIGGALLVTMNGPSAEIDINDLSGYGTVEVKGLFHATMLGSSPKILVGDDDGSGASPVKFDLGVTLLGSNGGGAKFEYGPSVTSLFYVPVFFTVLPS